MNFNLVYTALSLLTAHGWMDPFFAPRAAFGTLCVLDRRPRVLTPVQRNTIQGLARQVMRQIELFGKEVIPALQD